MRVHSRLREILNMGHCYLFLTIRRGHYYGTMFRCPLKTRNGQVPIEEKEKNYYQVSRPVRDNNAKYFLRIFTNRQVASRSGAAKRVENGWNREFIYQGCGLRSILCAFRAIFDRILAIETVS